MEELQLVKIFNDTIETNRRKCDDCLYSNGRQAKMNVRSLLEKNRTTYVKMCAFKPRLIYKNSRTSCELFTPIAAPSLKNVTHQSRVLSLISH